MVSDGSLLEYLVENQDNVSQKERLRFIIETGEAIEYLQQKSLIHRDIAVRNCLLDENMVSPFFKSILQLLFSVSKAL